MLCASPAAFADPGLPPICPPCPGGTQDVSVLVVPKELDDKTDWRFLASSWYKAPPGLVTESRQVVENAVDLRVTLIRMAQACRRVKHLAIFSHGNLGYVHLGKDGLSVQNLTPMLERLSCAMAPDARIELSGCNVGRGCRGEDFMMELAAILLPKGGSVQANTYYSSTFVPGLMRHTSLNLKTQTLTVSPGLATSAWEQDPMMPGDCRLRARQGLDEAQALKERVKACPNPPQNGLDWLDAARPRLESSAAVEEQRSTRGGYNPALSVSRTQFYEAFNFLEAARDKLREIGPCGSTAPTDPEPSDGGAPVGGAGAAD